jgi:hypothetical protein
VSLGLSTMRYKLVSSANSLISALISFTISFKTYNRLNIMRKSRTFLDRYSLEKNYISFIRPLMEYADVIWDNQNIGHYLKLLHLSVCES